MWDSERSDGQPSHSFQNDSTAAWQRLVVAKVRETVGTHNGVEFGLGPTLELLVNGYTQNEALSSSSSLFQVMFRAKPMIG